MARTNRPCSPDELAWLAGLLEGEGSFGTSTRSDNGRTTAHIRLRMTDKDVVKMAATLLGGYAVQPKRPQGSGRQWTYLVKVSGRPALLWMERLLPWMGARRTARIQEIKERCNG